MTSPCGTRTREQSKQLSLKRKEQNAVIREQRRLAALPQPPALVGAGVAAGHAEEAPVSLRPVGSSPAPVGVAETGLKVISRASVMQ